MFIIVNLKVSNEDADSLEGIQIEYPFVNSIDKKAEDIQFYHLWTSKLIKQTVGIIV